jgi:hypothetical protein
VKIKLAFVNEAPGRGKIRALIPGQLGTPVLIVGDYGRDGNGTWTARLYAGANNPDVLNGVVVKSTLPALRNAAGRRGRWWA